MPVKNEYETTTVKQARTWYEADALMANGPGHHHPMLASSEEEVKRRMTSHYPDAAVVLVHEQTGEGQLTAG